VSKKGSTKHDVATHHKKRITTNPKEQVEEEEQETEEVKPSPPTQKLEEDTNMDAQEVLADKQEPDQGTLSEGLNALLETYSDEEEVVASIESPTITSGEAYSRTCSNTGRGPNTRK
jgi:hypothetical protein